MSVTAVGERTLGWLLYGGGLVLVAWSGAAGLSYWADYRFYSEFLVPWHRVLTDPAPGRPWPPFRNNHLDYMTDLTRQLQEREGFRPPGEGRAAFMYRLQKPGQARQDVFLLALPGRMVLYGLLRDTAERVDRFVDGRPGLEDGTFRAVPASGDRMTGLWQT